MWRREDGLDPAFVPADEPLRTRPAATVVALPAVAPGGRAGRSPDPTIAVVLPARDEAPNLPWLFAHLPTMVDEVILVDGGSTDGTPDVARHLRPDLRVLEERAPGKGLAVATGLLAARSDVVVMLDADCSMDPGEIPAFVGALLAGADVVKGSRYLAGAGSGDLTLPRSVGNRSLAAVANVLYHQRWSELCYGYAAMWRDVVPRLITAALHAPDPHGTPGHRPVFGHGFEIEAVLFCRAARAGLRVVEVASIERPRKFGASNLRPVRDGTRVLRAILDEHHRARVGDVQSAR